MNFLTKLENIINTILIKLGELLLLFIPGPIKRFVSNFQKNVSRISELPSLIKKFLLSLLTFAKGFVATFDFKAIFIDSYKNAMIQYKARSSGSSSKLKTILLAPFLIMGQWLQGLSAAQAILLMTFTAGSIFSMIEIGVIGNRLVNQHSDTDRRPASVEELIEYNRPDYYKKSERHLEVTNLRLPVYYPQINEIRSVDVDFTATLSNRESKMILEKNEFQLRDFLILRIEPSIASFNLEEEGKEIMRQKILSEINEFLKEKNVIGEVSELKITYLLAN